uniref:Uncharacterized protein n=1 Tax=Salarias fasciatus TaxID=181472 RepID=A0A672J5W1_SALFA
MDRTVVGGQEVRLSLCTPGTSGRSTLAALIAAQGMILSNRKGLLPEPNLAQLLTSMTNPAALQILMRPYHSGKRGGISFSFFFLTTLLHFMASQLEMRSTQKREENNTVNIDNVIPDSSKISLGHFFSDYQKHLLSMIENIRLVQILPEN